MTPVYPSMPGCRHLSRHRRPSKRRNEKCLKRFTVKTVYFTLHIVCVGLILSPNIGLLIGLNREPELLFKIFVVIKTRAMIAQNIRRNGGNSG